MYKCNSCGQLFEEPKTNTENHGFTDGMYEHLNECPYCGGDYSEVEMCACCGDWHLEEDFIYGVCAGCIKRLADNKETAIKFIEESGLMPQFVGYLLFGDFASKESFLDKFAAYILEEKLQNSQNNVELKLKDYILDDERSFAEWLYHSIEGGEIYAEKLL